MRILITGGSGLLGQYLNIELSRENDILTLYNDNIGNCGDFNSARMNLTDFPRVRRIIKFFMPDVIIHTAAISRPESCDSMPEEDVLKINVSLTEELAGLCRETSAKLIYTSTDLVYDGDSGQMLKENSKLNPVSLYAKTKLDGEVVIENTFGNYIILRTSLLYGMGIRHSINNFHLMLSNFRNQKPVKLFYDQFRTPLSLIDAAKLISKLVRTDIHGKVINFGGKERLSRVELGEMLCQLGGFDRSLIEPISMNDVPNLYKVKDVSMNTSLLNSFGLNQKNVEESLMKILAAV